MKTSIIVPTFKQFMGLEGSNSNKFCKTLAYICMFFTFFVASIDSFNTLSSQSSPSESALLTFPANLPLYCPDFPFNPPGPPSHPAHKPSHPSPPKFLPSPPPCQTPGIFSPRAPSPPKTGTGSSLWCIAKPDVPDNIMQAALDYACGNGADCRSIQAGGTCFLPDSVISHASYALNSYWQATKAAGGTCDFGGTAILITKDPSFHGCRFIST